MNVFILAESLRTGDAVGNSALQECLALTVQGHQVKLYASNFDEYFKPFLIDRNALLKFIKMRDSLVLYHHSIFWEEGGIILDEAKCKILLRYHNITPDHFFDNYSSHFANLSKKGRQQTRAMIKSGIINQYLSDSNYNAVELIESGAPQNAVSVVAPCHQINDFEKHASILTC